MKFSNQLHNNMKTSINSLCLFTVQFSCVWSCMRDFTELISIIKDILSKTNSINLLKPSANYMYHVLQF
jgi:hypothetical protein